MNYFDEIFCELGLITWTDAHEMVDTITLYDDGQVMLLNEQKDGNVLIGKSCVDNIFALPDAIIEILTTIGKVTCRDNGELLTEQKIEL
jgi:hypothetical protein